MANVAKLKAKPKNQSKGEPPKATNRNLEQVARESPAKKGKIEFSVPFDVLDEFAQAAGQRFGFKKGSKSDLFLAMWEEYKSRIAR